MLTTRGSGSRPARAWVQRLTPAAVTLLLVTLAFCTAVAMEAQQPLLLVVVGSVVLSMVGLAAAARRRAVSERPWAGGGGPVVSRPGTSSPGAASDSIRVDEQPSRGAKPATTRQVVAALGRVEARELACSPWFALGIGFQLWLYVTFGVLYGDEDLSLWSVTIQQLAAFCHPLVGMVVVAAHAATTRARHDGASELYAACPAGSTARTVALLSTAWVPAVALAAFLALFLASTAVITGQVYGPAGRDALADLTGAVLLGVGGVVLGVAVGRWVSFRLAPVVAVVAVGALSLRMAADGGGWTSWAQLSTLRAARPEVFVHRAAWWHVAWLLGLTAVVVGIALARRDDGGGAEAGPTPRGAPSPALVIGGVGVAVAVLAGVLVTRPMPASAAERIADRVARPEAHQTCAPAGTPAEVCAFHGYGELRDRIVVQVTPVAAALPPGAGPLTLRQAYDGPIESLPPEVVRRLPEPLPPRPAGEVALSLEPAIDRVVATRFLLALAALGLPVAPELRPDGGRQPLVVAGQARGVVGLWLAARGMEPGAAADLATAKRRGQRGPTPPTADAFDRGFAWPTSCEAAPVVWSAQDLAAARALIGAPSDVVGAVVNQGWSRWRDPATTTDALLVAAGLAPSGPSDPVVTRDPGSC